MAATQPARGMRDFLPEDVRRRNYVVGVVRDVYERYGFEPLETPAVENIETLLGKYGDEGNKLIFKILKRGEHEASGQADLALRYDLTVPLARVVAEHQAKLPKFFKRYQVQPVWRADRPARGRFREFYQCDIDAIGSTSPIVEAEQIAAVGDVLTTLGFGDFRVLLNHRRVLTGMLDVAGIRREYHESALVALDKLDKIGDKGVEAEFEARGLDRHAASRLFEILRDVFTTPMPSRSLDGIMVSRARLESLRHFLGATGYASAVSELSEVLRLTQALTVAERVYIDPRLARGLSYYTGAIMEINVPDLAGSLGGGGRYDNLIGMFLGRDIPACGFSLGLERILVVMGERNMFPEDVQRASADIMVTTWDEPGMADSLKLAAELRRERIRVDVYPEPAHKRIGKQFKYAAERGFAFAAVLGDTELTTNTVTIKDLRREHQETIPRSEAASYVKTRLQGRRV